LKPFFPCKECKGESLFLLSAFNFLFTALISAVYLYVQKNKSINWPGRKFYALRPASGVYFCLFPAHPISGGHAGNFNVVNKFTLLSNLNAN